MSVMPASRQIGASHKGKVRLRQERIMIGTTARLALGTIVAAAMLIALVIALCADLMEART
jgi:hypothetical protein